MHVHNRSTSVSFIGDNTLLGNNDAIAPGCNKKWFYDFGTDCFDMIPVGSQSKTYTGKCYIKNGDVVSTTQSFSELGGDYFTIEWDKGTFDFKQEIEIYLSD